MKTAQKKLISGYFSKHSIDPERLLEVIEATGNPEVAMEILLGCYEQPQIPLKARYGKAEYTFKSFDRWKNEVNCFCVAPERKYIWIGKDVDENLITAANYQEYEILDTAVPYKGIYVSTGKMVEEQTKFTLSEWLEYAKRVN